MQYSWLMNPFILSRWNERFYHVLPEVQSVGEEKHIDNLEDGILMWSLSLSEGSWWSVTVNNQPWHYITTTFSTSRAFTRPSGKVVSKVGNDNVLSVGHRDLLTLVVKFKSCRKHKIYSSVSPNANLSRGEACILVNTVSSFTLGIWIYFKLQTNILLDRSTLLTVLHSTGLTALCVWIWHPSQIRWVTFATWVFLFDAWMCYVFCGRGCTVSE